LAFKNQFKVKQLVYRCKTLMTIKKNFFMRVKIK